MGHAANALSGLAPASPCTSLAFLLLALVLGTAVASPGDPGPIAAASRAAEPGFDLEVANEVRPPDDYLFEPVTPLRGWQDERAA